MTNRVRIVQWNVQPVVMVDDGEILTPLPVEALSIAAADWPAWAENGWRAAVEQLRAQVEGPSELTVEQPI